MRRCAEIVDLDQDPPVRYINIRAKAAQAEIKALDKLHKELQCDHKNCSIHGMYEGEQCQKCVEMTQV